MKKDIRQQKKAKKIYKYICGCILDFGALFLG